MFKVRRGGSEEIPLVQSEEQWLPFAGAAMKRYPTFKVRETQLRRQVCKKASEGRHTETIITETSQSNHTRTTALSNSMKLSNACGATQDGRVMVESSDRMWCTREGNGKPLWYSCLENPMNSMKRQEDELMTLKDELPKLVGAQCATGEQQRNNSRKNKEAEPKQKQHPVVNVSGGESKV